MKIPVSLPLQGLLAVLLLAGCRTYGGYGSEEAARTQLRTAVERFADELERARADARLLREVAAAAPALAAYVDAYEQTVTRHAALLEEHRARLEALGEDASYRTLSRALGAVVSEQSLIRDRYRNLLVAMAYPDTMPHVVRLLSGYQAVPPYYARIEATLIVPSAEDLLARYRGRAAG
ncbi:hypothetical protein GQ464_001590 [Rhodocaloribacter litoris]|uniref:hypothetical protein n=1 Tax=Rhodocaloribacter litoris TaxID=2558931 RepID=UPI00142128EA|nr:hypothetical protein [Rhodocaloribacter litoris]QXD15662.1 hypothetical protein GQ464_001590 [Rhodocaloribacter litoris]